MPYRSYAGNKNPANLMSEVKMETETETETSEATGNGDTKEVPAWLNKIKQGGIKKVPKDVQKRRKNFRLKKMVSPKPPMMVLFELVHHNEIQFENYISDPMTRMLKITARYDDKVFQGVGPSKNMARNICCEQILQHVVFKSCMKAAENEKAGPTREEETPWTALASVALFKLFNDWQAQGVNLPAELTKGRPMFQSPAAEVDEQMMEGVSVKVENLEKKKTKKPKEPKPKILPENPASRHPVQLLNEMEGPLDFQTELEGAPPHSMYTITVTLDEQRHSGTSRNKKEAKKLAAQSALAAKYNVHYPLADQI